jgi:membrane protein required for colicin V production
MSWLDIIVLLMLLIPLFIGWRRGLVGTVVPLVGLVVAIIVAGRFYGSVAGWFSTWLDSPAQANLLGFAIIFIAVLGAAMVVAAISREFLSLLLLGWVDRVGGLAFGLLIGGLVAGGLLTLVTRFFGSAVEDTVTDSALAAFLLDKFPLALYLLPGEFDVVRDFFI